MNTDHYIDNLYGHVQNLYYVDLALMAAILCILMISVFKK